MPRIEVSVDPDTRERLETERDLLGFEDLGAYVGWIVDNRAAIDQGTDRDQLLTAYAERVEQLERELAARNEAAGGDDADPGPAGGTPSGAVTSSGAVTPTGTDDGATGTGRREDPDESAEADATASHGESGTDGSPRADADGGDAAADGGTDAHEVHRQGRDLFVSGSFGERVSRIAGDEVNQVVDELTGVEAERVDAFARQAVAQTREQLGRDPQTGLTYRSDAGLQVPGTRPGSDLADLDGITVPGRSAEVRDRRRDAVGAALAYLRDEGPAQRSDVVEAVYADYPAGYGSEAGWWACVKQGLRQADRVDPAGEGSRTWEYDD